MTNNEILPIGTARVLRALVLLTSALASPGFARADLITGILEGANSTSFSDGGLTNCSSGATSATVAGFNITTDGAACLPASNGWSFSDNGTWYTLPAVGDLSGTTTITIDLHGEYSAVWGMMNYALSCGNFGDPCVYFGNDPTITALDKNMNVLESVDIAGVLNGSSSGDIDYLSGSTVGLTQSTPDIAYFQIGGDYIAMTDISTSGTPEPATLPLAGLALVALYLSRKGRTSGAEPSPHIENAAQKNGCL